MLISKDQSIAGIPAVEVRDLLRHLGFYFDRHAIAARSGVPISVDELIERLTSAGLIVQTGSGEYEQWELTLPGTALVKARLGKPMTRAKAQQNLDAFMARVREVNKDNTEPWIVTAVDLFGSFSNPDRATVGDIDLVVTFAERPGTDVSQRENEIRDEHMRTGRRFHTFLDELGYPLTLFKRRLLGVNQRLDVQFDTRCHRRLPEGVVLVPLFRSDDDPV